MQADLPDMSQYETELGEPSPEVITGARADLVRAISRVRGSAPSEPPSTDRHRPRPSTIVLLAAAVVVSVVAVTTTAWLRHSSATHEHVTSHHHHRSTLPTPPPRWTPLSTAGLPRSSTLQGISCPTSTQCWTTGIDPDGGFIVSWDGESWSAPLAVDLTEATAISCDPTGSLCAAGVDRLHTPSAFVALVRTHDRSVHTVLLPAAGTIAAVSCVSASFCAFGGALDNHYSVDAIDGVVFLGQPAHPRATALPAPPSHVRSVEVDAISCLTARSCFLAATELTSSDRQVTAFDHWNGTRWSRSPTSGSAPAGSTQVYALSCATDSSCLAAGSRSHGPSHAIAYRWNGASWAALPSPVLRSHGTAQYVAVACPSSTTCQLVGTVSGASRTGTSGLPTATLFAERWSSSGGLRPVAIYSTTEARSIISALSCTTTRLCVSVGYSETAGSSPRARPLAERLR